MWCSNSTGIFLLFLMNIFHDEILAKSNLYADQQRMANDHSPWTPITKEELVAFYWNKHSNGTDFHG